MLNLKDIPRPNQRFLNTIENVELHDHVCLLYRDKDEGLLSATAFIRAGIEHNDRCLYVADDNSFAEIAEVFERAGIDVSSAITRGQLEIKSKDGTYLHNGIFNPGTVIRGFTDAADLAVKDGFRAVRGCAELTWQSGQEATRPSLFEYESRLNDELFPQRQVVGMCQFNVDAFDAVTLRELIFSHPVIIIGGLMCKNIYYQPNNARRYHPADEIADYEVRYLLGNIYNFTRDRLPLT